MPDPIKKSTYDTIPMRNVAIDTLKSKFKIGKSGMPYNPAYQKAKSSFKIGKSGMPYNPARSSARNPKVNDSI